MSRLILLGSASSVPSAARDSTYLVWHGPSMAVLLDCGGSPLQKLQRVGVPLAALRHVILTHRHADHLYGLPALLQGLWLYERREPLSIWGPPDALDVARRIMDILDWSQWDDLFPIIWQPVTPGGLEVLFTEPDLIVSVTSAMHSVPTVAVRLQDRITDGVAVYSSDTAPCATIMTLAQGADLLVHEATFLRDACTGHSTAAQAGQVAQQAGVGRLVLVHVSPLQDDLEAVRQSAQAMFSGPVDLGRDEVVYPVQPTLIA
jgi:ribonuclease Z